MLGVMAWQPTLEPPAQSEIVLENVTLVMPGVARAEHQRLVVAGGRIAAIEPARRLDAPARSVLPGLVDMHVHLPPRAVPGLLDLFGSLLLSHGITTVREVGSLDGQAFELARQLEQGERLGPRIVACGPILDGDPRTFPVAQVVRTRAEGEQITRDLAARGARCVKVYEGISSEALAGIREAATELGMKLVGHVPAARPVSDSGLDDVQHLCYTRCGSASPEELEAFVSSSAERGVAHTPTLVVFEGQRLLAEARSRAAAPPYDLMPRFWREALWRPAVGYTNPDALAAMQLLVRRLHARGVRIHAGTDPLQPFVVAGASLRRELELLVDSGLSVEEALAAATWVAGDSLGIPGLGRLEVGAPADLLVLREDPTRDLAALGSLEAVIADGRFHPIDTLRASARKQRAYFDRTVVDLPLRAAARAGFEVARHAFARTHPEASP